MTVFQRLFRVRPARVAGQALYASAARQSRQPAFYRSLGVADSGEGRFELLSLHVALLVLRLRGCGEAAAETSQHLFDAFVSALDDALREMGVGDLVVGKRMRKLGEVFYGRVRAFDEAMGEAPDRAALQALLARTVLEGREGDASGLCDYALAALDGLRRLDLADLLEGRAVWPEAIT